MLSKHLKHYKVRVQFEHGSKMLQTQSYMHFSGVQHDPLASQEMPTANYMVTFTIRIVHSPKLRLHNAHRLS